ncbi:hypothetical protein KK083_15925 [Fulvivirgaceae bacterium PWU4]|uniref:Uncharacterized protein n=1 Tax=Chryseosolibacter histidini TaxID=2782349 RepID=A0AAP2GNU3_9BACT|nr:hypothetical protein [Chryseosolibacter histidini]MBT1698378.1 hypothetical protein [Chryseosolibacter histidini]
MENNDFGTIPSSALSQNISMTKIHLALSAEQLSSLHEGININTALVEESRKAIAESLIILKKFGSKGLYLDEKW